jgi:transposase-like protein
MRPSSHYKSSPFLNCFSTKAINLEEKMDKRRGRRRRFSAEKKVQFILHCFSAKCSVARCCKEQQISESMFYDWRKKFIKAGTAALQKKVKRSPKKQKNEANVDNTVESKSILVDRHAKYLRTNHPLGGRLRADTKLDIINFVENAAIPKTAVLIHGDGVNIAARLQEFAQPGSVCVSGTAFDQIEGKLEYGFVELGQQHFKNIAKPVRVYGFRPKILERSPQSAQKPLLDATTTKREPITGGCLCGAVRYEITGSEIDAGICHCKMCQKFTGSAFTIWACYPKGTVQFTQGEPKYYRSSKDGPTYYESSPIAERGFCPNCSSGLTFRGLIPKWSDWVFVYSGTFDNPNDFVPTWHLGTESQLPWLDIHDDLPRVRCYDSPAVVEAWGSVGLPVP